jgi:hypothetical protein
MKKRINLHLCSVMSNENMFLLILNRTVYVKMNRLYIITFDKQVINFLKEGSFSKLSQPKQKMIYYIISTFYK